eukprot:240551-Amphidinium_carterae.1
MGGGWLREVWGFAKQGGCSLFFGLNLRRLLHSALLNLSQSLPEGGVYRGFDAKLVAEVLCL